MVGIGYLTMNIYSTWGWYSGNKVTMRGSMASCSGEVGVPQALGKDYSEISKVCYFRCKNTVYRFT